MTDKEIIKALDEWRKAIKDDYKRLQLFDAPMDCFEESHTVNFLLLSNAIDLINRQQAEIEALKHYYGECFEDLENANAEIERLEKSTEKEFEQTAISTVERHRKWIEYRAIKEFADKLKEQFSDLEYTIKTNRKTMPVERVKAEMDAVLQNGCPNVIDKVLKELEGADNA